MSKELPRPGHITKPENIPLDIRARFKWCVYKVVRKSNGKLAKLPVAWRTGEPSRACDEESYETLGTFDECCNFMRSNADGHYGIGIVMMDGDSVLCFDADAPGAFDFLDSMHTHEPTYVETSISGKGRHYLWWGKLPHGRSSLVNKERGIEIYAYNRFIAITGNLVPGSRNGMGDGQPMFDVIFADLPEPTNDTSLGVTDALGRHLGLSDNRVVRILKRYKPKTLDRLDSPDNLADRSLDLLKIIGDLDKITGDPEQIRRIMSKSPMIRQNGYNAEKFQRNGTFLDWIDANRNGPRANTEALPNITIDDAGDGPSVVHGGIVSGIIEIAFGNMREELTGSREYIPSASQNTLEILDQRMDEFQAWAKSTVADRRPEMKHARQLIDYAVRIQPRIGAEIYDQMITCFCEVFGKRATVFNEMLKESKAAASKERKAIRALAVTNDRKPIIKWHSGLLANAMDDAEAALVKVIAPVFDYAGMAVRLEVQPAFDRQPPIVRQRLLKASSMYETLLRYLDWETVDENGNALVKRPPKEIAEMMITRADRWPYRRLHGVARCPLMRLETGELIHKFGYDDESGIFVTYEDELPMIAGGAREALARLRHLFREAAYADKEGAGRAANEAALIAGVMTTVLRPSFPVTPGWVMAAHRGGSGKSAPQVAAMILAAGHDMGAIAAGENREEFEKRLIGVILDGQPYVMLDNYNQVVKGEILAQVVTQENLKLRKLGASDMYHVKNNFMMMINGNNIEIEGEQRRRYMVCYLEPEMDNPENRTFTVDLFGECKRNRGVYLSCVFTIVREYIAAGCPVPQGLGAPLVGFSDWNRIVRGALVWLGMADPLATGQLAKMEDTKEMHRVQLMHALIATYGEREFKAAEVIADVIQGKVSEEMREAVRNVAEDTGGRITDRWLGKFLRKEMVGVYIGDYVVFVRILKGISRYYVRRRGHVGG